jgi:hypothetical protein
MKDISYIGFRNGDGNFGEFDHKILYWGLKWIDYLIYIWKHL